MKRVLLVLLLVSYGMIYAKSYSQANKSVEVNQVIKQHNKTVESKGCVDIDAHKEISISGSTYKASMISLVATMITLAKSNFNGVLSVDGNKITIRDCVIKSLVITNYEKVIIELLGKTVIQDGIHFIGDPGVVMVDPTVKVEGSIINGTKKTI